MIDAVRSYLQLASGMAEVSAARAKDAATAFVSHGVDSGVKGPEDLSRQLQTIAGDLLEQSKTNREILVGLVKTEVERAVGRMGFVREEELAAVRQHVQRLEAQLTAMTGFSDIAGSAVSAVTSAGRSAATAGRTAATAARSATIPASAPAAKKPAAKRPAAKKPAAKKPAAKKPAAKKSPAKKPAAKKAASSDKPATS